MKRVGLLVYQTTIFRRFRTELNQGDGARYLVKSLASWNIQSLG